MSNDINNSNNDIIEYYLSVIMPERKQITVKVEEKLLDYINDFVELNVYQSQADFIRDAIRDKLFALKGDFDNDMKKEFDLFDQAIKLRRDSSFLVR